MASQSQNNEIPVGQQKPSTTSGDYNNLSFIIQQALNKLQTATLVKIIACTNEGGISPVGFVDVQPSVNQIDGDGKGIPHGVIYNIPYFRIQGGADAIIIDPKPGDIGICLFASRDISKVKNTKNQANPGSYRSFNFADGLYVGGVLNGTPTQYIQFSDDGIKVFSNTKIIIQSGADVDITCDNLNINASSSITMDSPIVDITGNITTGTGGSGGTVSMTGVVTVTGDVIANGTSLHTHVHTSTSPGSPTSEPL
jgi:hypothetical protein